MRITLPKEYFIEAKGSSSSCIKAADQYREMGMLNRRFHLNTVAYYIIVFIWKYLRTYNVSMESVTVTVQQKQKH